MKYVPILSALALAAAASAQTTTVVPFGFDATEGNSSSSTLFTPSATSLQVFYSEAFLAAAGITPGAVLDGMAYRRTGGGTTGPLGDTTMAEYNIFMSPSFADPASMTTTYANNVVGAQTQVHGSSITFPANSFPGGGTPNAFGPMIDFSTPYVYTGGSLLIEVRRSARTGNTSSFNTDFDSTPGSVAGARMLFNLTSNTAATGTLSNGAHIFQLRYIPAPGSVALAGMAALALGRRRRR